MTISIWRYAHLVLAVFSSVFLTIASISGFILAIDAVQEKIPSHHVYNLNNITVAEMLPVIKKKYLEITQLSIDQNDFITLQAIDKNGTNINAYIDPKSGKITDIPRKKSAFIKWITSLHRSLFFHETGRFIAGLTAFLLLLITISGTVLIIQRQKSFRRFYSIVTKDSLAQYYHVVAGRLLLIPIFILALTGTYLSMIRFNIFPENKIKQPSELVNSTAQDSKKFAAFSIFKNIPLSQVQKIEFPFSEDPEEFYTIDLKDRKLIVDQFTGNVLNNIPYPKPTILANLSLNLHTGRINIIWAILLGIASLNIIFFIYSGFAMTLKRRATKIKNKHNATESKYILLAGSENGSTLRFANALHEQLLSVNEISYLTEPNNYQIFPNAQHIILFTSTYGLGHPPSNSDKLISLIIKYQQKQNVKVSVVGFGSLFYPNFCGYAKEVSLLFQGQQWAKIFLDLHLINNKSANEFALWIKEWNKKTGFEFSTVPAIYNQTPGNLQEMMVSEMLVPNQEDQTFMITIKPTVKTKFTSGDLLAIYPNNDGTERLYSICKSNKNIQLVVKLHPSGIGSSYLYNLTPGILIKARIIQNLGFHFPKKASAVLMISNGTGISPFLGMITQNKMKKDIYLYGGFRQETKMTLEYKKIADQNIKNHQLKNFEIAYSGEANQCYVMDLIKKDADLIADLLQSGGVIMICGSMSMLKAVKLTLDAINLKRNGKNFGYYNTKGQILVDCY